MFVRDFKKKYALSQRKELSSSIFKKYKLLPVICDAAYELFKKSHPTAKELSKHKLLVKGTSCMAEILMYVKKEVGVRPEIGIFLFVDNKLVPSNMLMSDVYELCKDEDGFLYVYYDFENVFGGS